MLAVLAAPWSCRTFSEARPGGSDAAVDASAPACLPETCADAGSMCRAYTFDDDCDEWATSGDDGALASCAGGALRVRAENTLDATASMSLRTPKSAYSVRVTANVAVTRWDGGPVLRVRVGGETAAEVRAAVDLDRNVYFELCDGAGACAGERFPSARGAPHVLTLDLAPTGVALEADCTTVARRGAAALALDDALEIHFGKTDGDPIEGSCSDLAVLFR